MTGRTKVVAGPFWTRRKARRIEREWQAELDRARSLGGYFATLPDSKIAASVRLPEWARGVRVEKAGRVSWVVVATESKGR